MAKEKETKKITIVDVLKNKKRSKWTFTQWQQKAPEDLARLRNDDPKGYQSIRDGLHLTAEKKSASKK